MRLFLMIVAIATLASCSSLSKQPSEISVELSKLNETLLKINKVTIQDFIIDSGMVSRSSKIDDELLRQRKILLTTKINNLASQAIIAKLFVLESLDNNKPIDIYLRTTGGHLVDAFAIINAINAVHPKVNVIAIGAVESAGTIILASATGKRIAYETSYINIHANRPKKVDKKYDKDNVVTESFESIYKSRTKIPESWYPLSNGSYFLTPQEAKEYGVIDLIVK